MRARSGFGGPQDGVHYPAREVHKKGRHVNHLRELWRKDTGAATAEYAIATMAAVGFAGLLVVILKGDGVRGLLTNVITGALGIGG